MGAEAKGKAVVKCPSCKRTQYWPEGRTACVACGFQIEMKALPELPAVAEPQRELRDWLGNRVQALRVARKLSQQAVAELMGGRRTYISKVERGLAMPHLRQLQRILAVLDVELRWFLDEEVTVEDLAAKTGAELRQEAAWRAAMEGAALQLSNQGKLHTLAIARGLARGQLPLKEWMEIR